MSGVGLAFRLPPSTPGLVAQRLEEFLAHMIEGYLAFDLVQLKGARVGYPLIMTSCGAIELFGALLSEKRFAAERGRDYFVWFWKKHLYPGQKSRVVANAVYTLVRNGIAHQF